MRKLTVLFAILLLASTAAAQDDKVEKEKKKFGGSYTMVSGEVDGKAVSDEHVKANRITFTGDQVSLVSPHQSKDPIKAKITRLDPSKKPAEMDWVRESGPNAGKPMMAIYEWIDDDTYRICFDPSGKVRPKEFKTAAGSGHMMHVWKRSK